MSTQAQAAASRANGAKSHGPTSAPGKARAAANSLKHGFTSKRPIKDEQSQAELDEITEALIDDLCPDGEVEENLVEEMAVAKFRLNRIRQAQEELLVTGDILAALDDEKTESNFRLLTRYEKEYNRQYQSAYKLLVQIRVQERAARQAQRAQAAKDQAAKEIEAYITAPTPGEPGHPRFRNEPGTQPKAAPNSPKPGFFRGFFRS